MILCGIPSLHCQLTQFAVLLTLIRPRVIQPQKKGKLESVCRPKLLINWRIQEQKSSPPPLMNWLAQHFRNKQKHCKSNVSSWNFRSRSSSYKTRSLNKRKLIRQTAWGEITWWPQSPAKDHRPARLATHLCSRWGWVFHGLCHNIKKTAKIPYWELISLITLVFTAGSYKWPAVRLFITKSYVKYRNGPCGLGGVLWFCQTGFFPFFPIFQNQPAKTAKLVPCPYFPNSQAIAPNWFLETRFATRGPGMMIATHQIAPCAMFAWCAWLSSSRLPQEEVPYPIVPFQCSYTRLTSCVQHCILGAPFTLR